MAKVVKEVVSSTAVIEDIVKDLTAMLRVVDLDDIPSFVYQVHPFCFFLPLKHRRMGEYEQTSSALSGHKERKTSFGRRSRRGVDGANKVTVTLKQD